MRSETVTACALLLIPLQLLSGCTEYGRISPSRAPTHADALVRSTSPNVVRLPAEHAEVEAPLGGVASPGVVDGPLPAESPVPSSQVPVRTPPTVEARSRPLHVTPSASRDQSPESRPERIYRTRTLVIVAVLIGLAIVAVDALSRGAIGGAGGTAW